MTLEEKQKLEDTRLLTGCLAAAAQGFFAFRNVAARDQCDMAMAAALMYYQGHAALEDDPERAIEAAKHFLDCRDSRIHMNSIRAYAKEHTAND
jgi:lipopolysaccharide biosynthesis regulator YciM